MRIRGLIIIVVAAAGLLASAKDYARLESSARVFQEYFQDLKTSGVAVNPIERFVFSLLVAKGKG